MSNLLLSISFLIFANSSLNNLGSCYHLSSQNHARFPSLISQKLCFWTMAVFSQDLFQMWEPLMIPNILMWSLSCQLFAYFYFQIRAQGEDESFSHLHHSFGPKTLFSTSRSSSPKPPCVLGLQIFSQATNAHFFSLPLCPKKNLFGYFCVVAWFL